MGILIEDLLNFGNLIDAELEIKLSPEELERAYEGLEFRLEEGFISVLYKKKGLLFSKRQEVRLSEGSRVKKDRDGGRQLIFFKVLSRKGIEELLQRDGFVLEGEELGLDVMPAVVLTETYARIPKQFRDKLLISRYKIGRTSLSVFFRFEK